MCDIRKSSRDYLKIKMKNLTLVLCATINIIKDNVDL